jgi:hypothetical protein
VLLLTASWLDLVLFSFFFSILGESVFPVQIDLPGVQGV